MDPDLRGESGGGSHFCAPSPFLWEEHPWLFWERQHVKVVSSLLLSPASPLSWRCLQWERPNALLEERERFIKDWRDRALSVFYWRLPAFLWACLLQQYGYVRLEAWGPLRCTRFGNNQRAPNFINFIKQNCAVFLKRENLRCLYLYTVLSFFTFTPAGNYNSENYVRMTSFWLSQIHVCKNK